jgi:hypothetical protein
MFVANREPLVAEQCAAVLRIPTKRAPRWKREPALLAWLDSL